MIEISFGVGVAVQRWVVGDKIGPQNLIIIKPSLSGLLAKESPTSQKSEGAHLPKNNNNNIKIEKISFILGHRLARDPLWWLQIFKDSIQIILVLFVNY